MGRICSNSREAGIKGMIQKRKPFHISNSDFFKEQRFKKKPDI